MYNHPDRFKEGVRVGLVVTRHKDGSDKTIRKPIISSSLEDFNKVLEREIEENEHLHDTFRIYFSLSPRDANKAIREFKRKQLDADYDNDPLNFYMNLKNRWASSLMQDHCVLRDEKFWMFDCDSEEEYLFTLCQRL